jgi:prolipoprotein diacylglyceryl transferase
VNWHDRAVPVVGSIPSPSFNGIHVGPFDVRIYGLGYVLAVLAAVAITARRWEAQGGSRELVQDVALWGFPAGVLGGRLYFLATSWNEVPGHWWGPFAVWKGGLGIWGGIALGTAAGIWRLRRAGADVPRFLDAAAPALLVAQAIGRIGNYFNQELYGRPTSLPWGLEIDRDHRPERYLDSATFHPTFLYELIWNLALAALLAWLGRRRAIRPPGLFALYVAGYSAFRIFEELLRVDPAKHVLGLRLNFFIAAVLTVVGLTWFVRTQRRVRENGRHEEEPMRIVVFGAGGRVGTRTVAEALARGHDVTAVVRDPAAHDLDRDGLSVVAGDATDPSSVAEVAAGHDLAISTVGTGFGKTPETLPAAARGLLEGLSRAGVARLIVLGGAGSLEVAPGVRVLDTEGFREEWKPDALAQAESLDIYRSATTDVDWTYVSPAALLEPGERTGEYRTGDDRLLVDDEGKSAISMEDFAVALLDEAESADHVRRRFTVAS